MKKSNALKVSTLLLSFFIAFSTTACDRTKKEEPSTAPSMEATVTPDAPVTQDATQAPATASPRVNKSINKIEAGLGDLKLYYNKNWTYDAENSKDASLAFTRGDTLIGVVCSKEKTFQLPEDMMKRSLDMVSQQSEDFKLIADMKKINVNGDTWYECSYKAGKGEDEMYSIQRTYGKGYYGYTITYTGLKKDFEAFESNALTILDSCLMEVPDEATGEEEAKKELVGELDAGKYGYLELKDDGTYYWYSDSSKEMDNVHYGTYACDNKIPAINIQPGQKGYYVALFPSKYFVNGVEKDMGTYKIDLAISKATKGKADYQGVNLVNYTVYDFMRVK